MAEEKTPPEEKPAQEEEAQVEHSGDADFSKKHPLEYGWTLWFDAGSAGKSKANSWGSSLRSVYTFDTVEDFWRWATAEHRDPNGAPESARGGGAFELRIGAFAGPPA